LEASSTETELFEKLLGAEVEKTHRAAGDLVLIKFLIKERKDIPVSIWNWDNLSKVQGNKRKTVIQNAKYEISLILYVSESGTAWIAKNYEKVAQYEGKYIAVVNSQIVASAETSGEVMKIVVQQLPNSHPVIMKVPNKTLTF
jgi:hypothetical protein